MWWTPWLELVSPLIGVAAAALLGRLSWTRGLAAAATAGIVAMSISLWRGGLLVAGPRAIVGTVAGRPNAGDYAWMLAWAALYGLIVGAIAIGCIRVTIAAFRPRTHS